MCFEKGEKIRYDLHQIIYYRKKQNECAPFKHETVEGLEEIANLEIFHENEHGSQLLDAIQQTPLNLVTPTPQKYDLENKRGTLEVVDMEIEEAQSSNKRLKGDKGKNVININEEK